MCSVSCCCCSPLLQGSDNVIILCKQCPDVISDLHYKNINFYFNYQFPDVIWEQECHHNHLLIPTMELAKMMIKMIKMTKMTNMIKMIKMMNMVKMIKIINMVRMLKLIKMR